MTSRLQAFTSLFAPWFKKTCTLKKQQFFTVLFYLFLTLLVANVVGMIPYSFTITSSFVVTFFLAMTHFVAINHIAAVKHE